MFLKERPISFLPSLAGRIGLVETIICEVVNTNRRLPQFQVESMLEKLHATDDDIRAMYGRFLALQEAGVIVDSADGKSYEINQEAFQRLVGEP